MTIRQLEILQHGSHETALGLSKEDFFDLCRQFKPDLTRAEFESDWGEFQRQKAEREAKRRVQ